MNRAAYQRELAAARALPEEAVRRPNQPVAGYLQEAENLYRWVQRDRKALVAAGLDWALVEALPVRAAVLRDAEARWMAQRRDQRKAARAWATERPRARTLLVDLIACLRFACRDDPAVQARLKGKSEPGRNEKLIQDLSDVAALGRGHRGRLTRIGCDVAVLDTATRTAGELAHLYARVVGPTGDERPKIMRDRAFSHLRSAVDELRAYGRFVFRGRPERRRG